jgi:hypothetical protein
VVDGRFQGPDFSGLIGAILVRALSDYGVLIVRGMIWVMLTGASSRCSSTRSASGQRV